MKGRLAGRVAFVTGAARGQGRAHAVALAEAGADVVVTDGPVGLTTVPYDLPAPDELEQTRKLVEGLGRRCLSGLADVRDADALAGLVQQGVDQLGRIDIGVANAGICTFGKSWELPKVQWQEMIDVNLTGVFNTVQALLPTMREQRYGRLIAVSSRAGRQGTPNLSHYTAAKFGVIGFMKSVAIEVADAGVTANVVCPTNVATPMLHNEAMYRLFCPDLDDPPEEVLRERYAAMNVVPTPWIEPERVARVVAFLADEDSAEISGATYEVTCGASALLP
ncbi:MAG TPA: mycofactocin-coupled SDR family oxidoreductase [Acidimicrobiales bacterium]|nr:mycofactocin-coupled SDR family oxidoreductase [Acidimicrobiales bacterium]